MVYTYNHSIQEAEAGGLRIWGSLNYKVSPSLKTSYLESWDWEDWGLRSAQANSFRDSISTNKWALALARHASYMKVWNWEDRSSILAQTKTLRDLLSMDKSWALWRVSIIRDSRKPKIDKDSPGQPGQKERS
jgi:hypothetical protein